MGNILVKCLQGETDLNGNGIPDNKDLINLVENYIKEQKDKKNKKILKKIFK